MSLDRIMRVPGQLCLNPTNGGLATAFPHGGTTLGIIKSVAVRHETVTYDITAEEYGSEVVDRVYGNESWAIAGIMREWNNLLIDEIFYNTTPGGSSSDEVISYPGAVRAGRMLAQDGQIVMFSPDDLTNHEAAILYRAIPLIDEAQIVNMAWKDEAVIGFAFQGVRDGSERVVKWGKIEDLSI